MSIKKVQTNHLNSIFQKWQNVIYLWLIILLGATLRIYNLGTESFWFDEIFTVHQVTQDIQTLLHQLVERGDLIRNAVYYLLAHFWVQCFSVTESSIRSLSAIFGVLSIGMMYLVGERLFGTTVGLLSSFFMAVSAFQIQYSQEARFYSLFLFATLASLNFYVLALRTNQTGLWIFSSLINILLFYTHTYAIFIFSVEFLHYLFYWRKIRNTLIPWVVSQTFLFLAIGAVLVPMVRDGSVASLGSGLAWIPGPSIKDLFRTVYGYLFPQNYQHSWFFIATSVAAGSFIFIVGALLNCFRKTENLELKEMGRRLRKTRFPRQVSGEFMLTATWFLIPIMLPFIFSIFFTPIFVDRYTICAAPAFYILVAILIVRISRAIPIYIPVFAILVVIMPGLQDYFAADINEQWREAAVYVQENSQPNDVIIFSPDEDGYQTKSFAWYYQGEMISCGIGSDVKDDKEIKAILSNCTKGFDRFWVIMRGSNEAVGRFTTFFLNSNEPGMHMLSEKRFVKISVYLFDSFK